MSYQDDYLKLVQSLEELPASEFEAAVAGLAVAALVAVKDSGGDEAVKSLCQSVISAEPVPGWKGREG